MPTPDDSPTLFGCVILTSLGRCLVQCSVGGRAEAELQTSALCQLVATLQDVGGKPPFGYIELQGVGVVLQEGHRVIIAVLCHPTRGQASARLAAMQALNVFGKLFHAEVDALADAHEREANAAINSYTFHSATQSRDAGERLETLPAFAEFQRGCLQPLLLRPPSARLWLAPLLEPAGALSAWLVNPSPLRSEQPILLGPPPPPPRPSSSSSLPLAAFAGPQLAAVWDAALEQARALLQARAMATDKQNKKPRLAALAFPAAAAAAAAAAATGTQRGPAGGAADAACLHVALRPARVAPGGACLLLFYQAPPPPPRREGGAASPSPSPSPSSAAAAAAAAGADDGGGVLLTEASIPHDVRAALHGCARVVSAAFPTSVTDMGAAAAAAAAATGAAGAGVSPEREDDVDEDARSPPATPRARGRTAAGADGGACAVSTPRRREVEPLTPAPPTPVQLLIESPRAGE